MHRCSLLLHMSFVACVCVSARVFGPIRVPYSYRSLGNLVVSREVPCFDGLCRSSRKKQGHNEVGFPAPSSACGLYLGIGAQLHSRGVWFEEQSTHAALGRLAFVSPHVVRLLSAPKPHLYIGSAGFFGEGGAQPINKHFPPMVLHFDL